MPRGEQIEYSGDLFEIRTEAVDDNGRRYEFVQRRPAITTLPIRDTDAGPEVITIFNQRRGYAGSIGLPGGNLDGPFNMFESVEAAALRELQEEIGHAPRSSNPNSISTFTLRPESSTIDYARLFAVVRDVHHVGGELNSDSEVITLKPQLLEAYVQEVIAIERDEQYPAICLAFIRAERKFGIDALVNWLSTGDAEFETGIFAPYMTEIPPDTGGEFSSLLWEQ